MNLICKELVNLLKEKKLTLSCAESCTGGLVAKMITDVSGSSEAFFGGVVSYTEEIKHNVLGVSAETLEKYGVYSHNTATEMADGVRKLMSTDIGISTTGIAGPGGGNAENPVGTVHFGISYLGKTESVKECFGENTGREEIREQASEFLIKLLINKIAENC